MFQARGDERKKVQRYFKLCLCTSWYPREPLRADYRCQLKTKAPCAGAHCWRTNEGVVLGDRQGSFEGHRSRGLCRAGTTAQRSISLEQEQMSLLFLRCCETQHHLPPRVAWPQQEQGSPDLQDLQRARSAKGSYCPDRNSQISSQTLSIWSLNVSSPRLLLHLS